MDGSNQAGPSATRTFNHRERDGTLRGVSERREPDEREDAGASVNALREMLADDPYKAFRLAAGSKRIVTFLREKPKAKLALPIEMDGARILVMSGQEIFSAYIPSPKGAVFLTLIEKTFGKDVTTRTWETVTKVAR